MRAYGVSADDHAFDDAVGIAFHEASVHVSAGIAFIAVGDDIFGFAVRLAHAFPLDSRMEIRRRRGRASRLFSLH